MNAIENDSVVFSHEREPDGRVAVIVLFPGGEKVREALYIQEPEARTALIDKLLADKPGLGRNDVKRELGRIARATIVDLRWDIHRVNGRAPASARLWNGNKPIDATRMDLFEGKSRTKAVDYLAPFLAPLMPHKKGTGSQEKLNAAKRELHRLFKEKLQEVMTAPAPQRPGFDPAIAEKIPYDMIEGVGILWRRPMAGGGEDAKLLTNFTARITANVFRTDGVERTCELEIEAALKHKKSCFAVKSTDFGKMDWPLKELGGEAVIEPENGFRERARTAIQKLSTNIAQKTIYTHTGWRQVGGEQGPWAYLHAGGIIAAAPIEGIEVGLSDAVARYHLPGPPADPEWLKRCIQASLKILELAPHEVVFPTYCAVWRSILGNCDSSNFLVGRTQSRKSELAALAARHFGPTMHAKNLPGAWTATFTYLMDMAFKLKDALFIIDDFKTAGMKGRDIDALHKLADWILRAQGNRSGRGRGNEYGDARALKVPRGMILCTGEEVPRGESLRARMTITDVAPKDIDNAKLGVCQKDAREGVYAAANAGFIRWLADDGRIGRVQDGMLNAIESQRAKAFAAQKRADASADLLLRTPENTANLHIGFRHFLDFAVAQGAVGDTAAAKLLDDCWAALLLSAQLQARYQGEQDPSSRFLQLIQSALSSGLAHLSGPDGAEPGKGLDADFDAIDAMNNDCGYRRRGAIWEAQRTRIGWIDPDAVLLDIETSFRIANDVLGQNGDGIGVSSAAALGKYLKIKGLLLTEPDEEHGRRTGRKRSDGELRRTWRMSHASLQIAWPNEGGRGCARTVENEPDPAPLEDQSFDFAGEMEDIP